MVPHSWILESLELVQVSDNILQFVKRCTVNWQTELTSCGESLTKINISRGVFQGDSSSPSLCVICMILLTYDTANLCTTENQGKLHLGRRREK